MSKEDWDEVESQLLDAGSGKYAALAREAFARLRAKYEVPQDAGPALPATEDAYYVRDSRSVTGNCVMFWRKNNAGYTYNLDDCRIFTKEEAFRQNRMRDTDIPYPKSLIDSLAERHLDVQDLHRHYQKELSAAPEQKGPTPADGGAI